MDIKQWDIKGDPPSRGMMVRLTVEEAIKMIKSMSHQIMASDPNVGVETIFCHDAGEFSIRVLPNIAINERSKN